LGSAEGGSVRMDAKSPAPLLRVAAISSPSRINDTSAPAGPARRSPSRRRGPRGSGRSAARRRRARVRARAAVGRASAVSSSTVAAHRRRSRAMASAALDLDGLIPRRHRGVTGPSNARSDHDGTTRPQARAASVPLIPVPPPASDVMEDLPGSCPRTGVAPPPHRPLVWVEPTRRPHYQGGKRGQAQGTPCQALRSVSIAAPGPGSTPPSWPMPPRSGRRWRRRATGWSTGRATWG
jgi:hypothetical protein